MGWANDALERDLAKAGIFPINNSSYRGSSSYSSDYSNKRKKKLCYHEYSFPTDAQIRALRFITMHTSIIFEGKTKEQARVFIAEHMDYAIECSKED